MTLSIAKAELIGSFLETICYGAYLMVHIECLRVLCRKYGLGKPMHYLLCTALIIFCLVTLHFVVDVIRVIQAFTTQMGEPNAPVTYYGQKHTSLFLIKNFSYMAVTLVSDTLIVYRMFLIWERNYLIAAVPFLLLVADIATSIWASYQWSTVENKPGSNTLIAKAAATLGVNYFYAMTLGLNLTCTLMICWKICLMKLRTTGPTIHTVNVTSIISMILESAAIYSAFLIILIATSALGESATFIVLDAISPIIGMVFSTMIIRTSRESISSGTPLQTLTISEKKPEYSV